MHRISPLYTDLYQLTMSQAYYVDDRLGEEACFEIYFRSNPFDGGFAVASGIDLALDFLEAFHFSDEDIAYLRTLNAADGSRLFRSDFLDVLATWEMSCDIDAVSEGTLVFAGAPLLRITGPIALCQLVETPLLNYINFSTLVATKAARCYIAAEGDPILEFGLRRAQGLGGLMASRASYVGGCAATSNTLAGKLYDIPVAGTHAHSFVMAFDDELSAFEAYVKSSPNNIVLLVDTYDTLKGVEHAIEIGKRVTKQGYKFAGIRIDSGDLAWFSKRARAMLNEAGFENAAIYASNELDEHTIRSLKEQHAPISVWGVGTKLATAYDQPALGGIYKLTALRAAASASWMPKMKLSEQVIKSTLPGVHNVRRFYNDEGAPIGDMVFDINLPTTDTVTMVDPFDATRQKSFGPDVKSELLLQPVMQSGRRIVEREHLRLAQRRALDGLNHLDETHKRFLRPHTYAVGLERGLNDMRLNLIKSMRGID